MRKAMKVGIDVIENERAKKIESVKSKIFTQNELSYIEKFTQKEEHYCAIFCAKEAVFKCLNLNQIFHKEIEILHSENGRPYAIFHGKTEDYFNENFKEIDISISHSKRLTTAIAIATEKAKISLL